jgi:rfaE bifunctional protein kinase chain/domain
MSNVFTFHEIRSELDKHGITRVDILNALESMPKSKVLLIGDFIIDLYTYCTAIGKTSKTPTLSVKKESTDRFWGGTGLFAKNLLGLGAEVSLVTMCGRDWGYDFIMEEHQPGLKTHLFVDENRPSTLKERFWVDGYKLLQVDTLENDYVSPEIRKSIEATISKNVSACDFVLVSDFRHGLLSPELISFIKSLCKEKGKRLIVDTQVSSRSGNLEEYLGVDLICANETEARYFLRDERSDTKVILDKLFEQTHVNRLILKLGLKGLIGYNKNKEFFQLPSIPVEVKDPIGSGDAFLSVAALTCKPEIKLMASIFAATCAGSLAVTKMGTVPNNLKELTEFVEAKLDEIF